MTWSIDPASARSILDGVMARVTSIDATAEGLGSAVDDATAAMDDAPATKAALAVVGSDPLLMGIAAARRYVEEVVLTVDSVIRIYEQGDLEMALQTQRHVPGEPR